MKKDEVKRLTVGYIIGLLIFVIFIPYLIYFASRLGSNLLNTTIINLPLAQYAIAASLFIPGMIFTVWANVDLLRRGKGGPTDIFNVDISPRSKNLVVTGPYRYTRNPMVFGVNAVYFSIALYINSWTSLIFCTLFFIFHVFYLKITEEKRLTRDFGDAYIDDKKRVPMIFPLPKR